MIGISASSTHESADESFAVFSTIRSTSIARQRRRYGEEQRSPAALVTLLRDRGVGPTSYLVVADESGRDALPLEEGVRELLQRFCGAVLICPPHPVAIYKQEGVGEVYLLARGVA